jgi:hypothetical protein
LAIFVISFRSLLTLSLAFSAGLFKWFLPPF